MSLSSSQQEYEIRTSWHFVQSDSEDYEEGDSGLAIPSSSTSTDDDAHLEPHPARRFLVPAVDANSSVNVFLIPIEELMARSTLLCRSANKQLVTSFHYHVIVPRQATIAHMSKYLELKHNQPELDPSTLIWTYPFTLYIRTAAGEYAPSVWWSTMTDLLGASHNRRPYGADASFNLIRLYYTHKVMAPLPPVELKVEED